MKSFLKTLLAIAAVAVAAQAAAQVTVYGREGFRGPSFVADRTIGNLEREGYDGDTGSILVENGSWEVCDDNQFRGQCVVLRAGRYPTLAAAGLNNNVGSIRRAEGVASARAPEITLYGQEGFGGRALSTKDTLNSLESLGFNDRASSVVVEGGPWEVCEDAFFRGRCVVLRPGRYTSLAAMGMSDRISSMRRVDVPPPVAALPPPPAPRAAEIVFYDRDGFAGRNFTARADVPNFRNEGFNDVASSVTVVGGWWEACSDASYSGRCVVLRPGQYPTLASMSLDNRISSVRHVGDGPRAETPPPVVVVSSATFFEQEGFRGRSFATQEEMLSLERSGFGARAESAEITAGRWDVCEDPRFGGKCMQLSPGRYPTVESMGLSDRVASVRKANADARVGAVTPGAMPMPVYDARRRGDERLFQANVTSVREVKGTAEQRCWVEREPQSSGRQPNVGGLLAGALIGGILGHQVGGGTGKDLATVGGVVAGAAIGANVGNKMSTQDVQRCSNDAASAKPSYWEVTYNFRGIEHRVQMASPPQSQTVTVNAEGEPRV